MGNCAASTQLLRLDVPGHRRFACPVGFVHPGRLDAGRLAFLLREDRRIRRTPRPRSRSSRSATRAGARSTTRPHPFRRAGRRVRRTEPARDRSPTAPSSFPAVLTSASQLPPGRPCPWAPRSRSGPTSRCAERWSPVQGIAYQQDGDMPARGPGTEHPVHERAGDPCPPRKRHALPNRHPGHRRTRPSRPPDRGITHASALPVDLAGSQAGVPPPFASPKQGNPDRTGRAKAVRMPA
jgi:hypothetical protein